MITLQAPAPTADPAPVTGRGREIAFWTTTALLGLILVSGAFGEFSQQAGTLETESILGFPPYFLYLIGTWKLLGTAAILVPGFRRLKEWAYAGMFFNMSGAFIAHAVRHDFGAGGYHLLVTGGVLVLVVASWALRSPDRVLAAR
ncbi:DoxX family protein [Nocardia stercoris]|uniref:DoxX family protein n=1 Tax=Nocardia stercoris TaxID=2483361 RepID=A0A3M2KQS2_9NOCA|nr:DoxX family protein [Nocardia stercoris]RMI27809.1 DoxX family protein [Nocardia stercoris]